MSRTKDRVSGVSWMTSATVREWYSWSCSIGAALAVTTSGGVLVPVNTRFRGGEAAYVLGRSRASALFTVRGFLDTDYPALLADAGVELPALDHTVLLAGEADDGSVGWKEF